MCLLCCLTKYCIRIFILSLFSNYGVTSQTTWSVQCCTVPNKKYFNRYHKIIQINLNASRKSICSSLYEQENATLHWISRTNLCSTFNSSFIRHLYATWKTNCLAKRKNAPWYYCSAPCLLCNPCHTSAKQYLLKQNTDCLMNCTHLKTTLFSPVHILVKHSQGQLCDKLLLSLRSVA